MSEQENQTKRKFDPSLIFGTWTPPPYLKKMGAASVSAARSAGAFLRRYRKVGFAVLSGIAAVIVAALAFSFWQARQPKVLTLTCSVDGPSARYDWESPVPAAYLSFSGSASPADSEGKAVTEGISISPEIGGSWKWESDSLLSFTPDADWPVGQEYRVSFAKGYFPSHLKAPNP